MRHPAPLDARQHKLAQSPSDVAREYLRQWKEVTARDGTAQPQTILSTLWFVPVWFKYNATPYILRYLVYCLWVVIKAAYFRWHKAMVLQGCKLDAWLVQHSGRQASFSRRQALERYHFKAKRFSTLSYRLGLYLGNQVPAIAS
ncbi:hypothetical protein WJX81_000468 [Elliptochloris bilobata]|uniref:Uncharacterized protein n=1 Tax=Elliptochloris bilobata TaxID=381761 RepID=A0AAW1SCY3_9CHLO